VKALQFVFSGWHRAIIWLIARMIDLFQPAPLLMEMARRFDRFVEHAKRVSSTNLVYLERNRYSVPAFFASQLGRPAGGNLAHVDGDHARGAIAIGGYRSERCSAWRSSCR
jgi:hypothetical protein